MMKTQARQHGAALVTALLFLVILTLLGLAALRYGRTDLRLTLNDASRIDALQTAQAAADIVTASIDDSKVQLGSGYVMSCLVGTGLNASNLSTQGFSCGSSVTNMLPDTGASNTWDYSYVSLTRESISGADFAPTSVARNGDSGSAYQLASFSVIGGYDRTGNSATGQLGAAEVQQGVYLRVANVRGLALQ